MNRVSRVLLAFLIVLFALLAPLARSDRQEKGPAPVVTQSPAPPTAASPSPHDNLEEFVPKEKVKADSIVAFPVDI